MVLRRGTAHELHRWLSTLYDVILIPVDKTWDLIEASSTGVCHNKAVLAILPITTRQFAGSERIPSRGGLGLSILDLSRGVVEPVSEQDS